MKGRPRRPGSCPKASSWIVSREVASLVVDLPSLDRGDDPSLAAHRAYWGLPAGGRRAAEASRATALVTELAYVPDRMLDGLYLLELQIAPFASDAAPSRPGDPRRHRGPGVKLDREHAQALDAADPLRDWRDTLRAAAR